MNLRFSLLIALSAVASAAEAPSPDRQLLIASAPKTTNNITCLLTWNASPPQYEVVQYSIFQAANVQGPYEQVAATQTNELLIVVPAGTYFWNVRAVRLFQGVCGCSEPSAVVGLAETKQGGLSVIKQMPSRTVRMGSIASFEGRLPVPVLFPLKMSAPTPTNVDINLPLK